MPSPAPHVRTPALWQLVFLVCFCAVGAVVVSPAIGDIARHLNIKINQAEQMMSIYLLGYAIGQLLYGPLAEALGRKRALLIGVLITLFGSLLAVIALLVKSFILFLAARFLMALGSSSSLVISFILVNDTSRGKELGRRMSLLFSSIAVAVPTTTAIAGYIQVHFDWPSIFWAFILYCVGILCLVETLPETGSARKKGLLSIDFIANRYFSVLEHKKLKLHALMFGCCASIIYVFSTLAPVITVELLGVSPKVFGMMNYFPYFGMLLGSTLSAFLISFRKTKDVLSSGFFIMGVGALMLLVFSFMPRQETYALFFPMFLIFAGLGMVTGNIAVLALSDIADKAYATAMYNFIALSMSVIATLLVGLIPHIFSYKALTASIWVALIIIVFLFYLVSDER